MLWSQTVLAGTRLSEALQKRKAPKRGWPRLLALSKLPAKRMNVDHLVQITAALIASGQPLKERWDASVIVRQAETILDAIHRRALETEANLREEQQRRLKGGIHCDWDAIDKAKGLQV